jgi:hypothetical protein
METNQPTTTTVSATYAPAPGMFASRGPSTIAFLVAILVFLLPFTEIRCGGTKIMTKSGLDYALDKEWKTVAGGLPDSGVTDKSMDVGKEQKGNTRYYILGAAGLGILGLLLGFANSRGAMAGGILTGVLAAGALIAFMIELKNNFANSLRDQAIDKATEGVGDAGMEGVSRTMNDIKPTLAFTPWFYIAVIGFVAAALFCYLRMRSPRPAPRM